jgi:hypothetical protein
MNVLGLSKKPGVAADRPWQPNKKLGFDKNFEGENS